MKLKTKICDLLHIEHPILQGGMAWIAGGKLAAAVSAAGGLGIIGGGTASPSWLENEIIIARKLTTKHIGVNLMLTGPHVKEHLDLVIREKIPVVTTGGGNPGPYMEALKNAGIKIIPVVAAVALAKRLERLGADALIVEGTESGGHIGEMTTMCLVPLIADEVTIPIIAAGGIYDARGLVAALALGAEGVQMGTRFICAQETDVHPAYQEKIIKARDRSTVVCGLTTRHPVRAIQNPFARDFLQAEREGRNKEELSLLGQGKYPLAAVEGNVDQGSLLAGQISAMVKHVQPAGDIIEEIAAEAHVIIKRLGGLSWPS